MLAPCSICCSKTTNYVEVQKYLFGFDGLRHNAISRFKNSRVFFPHEIKFTEARILRPSPTRSLGEAEDRPEASQESASRRMRGANLVSLRWAFAVCASAVAKSYFQAFPALKNNPPLGQAN